MDAEERKAHERRLKHLQVRAALQGISTPPEIAVEIEDIEQKLRSESSDRQDSVKDSVNSEKSSKVNTPVKSTNHGDSRQRIKTPGLTPIQVNINEAKVKLTMMVDYYDRTSLNDI